MVKCLYSVYPLLHLFRGGGVPAIAAVLVRSILLRTQTPLATPLNNKLRMGLLTLYQS